MTKVPGWHGLIAWDALLNGMATGLFMAAAVSELAAPAIFIPVAKVAYPVALVLLLVDLALLVSIWAIRCGSITCCGFSSPARRCRWERGAW